MENGPVGAELVILSTLKQTYSHEIPILMIIQIINDIQ